MPRKKQRPDTPRPPPDVTPAALERAALSYLERFDSTVSNLGRVLGRRIRKAEIMTPELDGEQARRNVTTLLERYASSGILNDRRFAQNLLAGLRGRGTSMRAIGAKLRARGVPELIANEVMADEDTRDSDSGNPELDAARAYVRRRRLGPFRSSPLREERAQKDLASLARAGFRYDIARRALEPVEPVEPVD